MKTSFARYLAKRIRNGIVSQARTLVGCIAAACIICAVLAVLCIVMGLAAFPITSNLLLWDKGPIDTWEAVAGSGLLLIFYLAFGCYILVEIPRNIVGAIKSEHASFRFAEEMRIAKAEADAKKVPFDEPCPSCLHPEPECCKEREKKLKGIPSC